MLLDGYEAQSKRRSHKADLASKGTPFCVYYMLPQIGGLPSVLLEERGAGVPGGAADRADGVVVVSHLVKDKGAELAAVNAPKLVEDLLVRRDVYP